MADRKQNYRTPLCLSARSASREYESTLDATNVQLHLIVSQTMSKLPYTATGALLYLYLTVQSVPHLSASAEDAAAAVACTLASAVSALAAASATLALASAALARTLAAATRAASASLVAFLVVALLARVVGAPPNARAAAPLL